MTRSRESWRAGVAIAVMVGLFSASALPKPPKKKPPPSSAPQAQPTALVTVRCNQPPLVAGLPLRVLRRDGADKELAPVATQTRFDASGTASVGLEPGTYVFEAAAARGDGAILMVQSDAIVVPGSNAAMIIAGEPHELRLSHKTLKLQVSQVGVRSAAAVGQTRWQRKTPAALPRLVLTPGRSTTVNLLGSSGSVHVAAWARVTAENGHAAIQIRPKDDWNECRFVRRTGSPLMRSVTAKLVFPDSTMEIPVVGSTRVLTNRRFLMMGYRLELPDGRRMEFVPLPYNIDPVQKWEYGGQELMPRAWADYVGEQEGPTWWARLTWRVDLLDPGGHRLNIYLPNCGVTRAATGADGGPLPEGRISQEEKKRIGDPTKAVRIKVQWQWNGNHSRDLVPEPYALLRSEHFQIHSVPAWQWQAQNYLSKAERCYVVERQATGRPGPSSVNVTWWHNPGGKAMIGRARGGQKLLWSALPFRGYEHNQDPFNDQQPFAHEVLHTFGYNHGDEMSRLERLVKFEFTSYRWYLVDHPDKTLEIVRGVQVGDTTGPPDVGEAVE